MSIKQTVTRHFVEQFGSDPRYLVRAPGRVNLIGEHSDYNEGFVLPIAIDRAIWIAFQPRDDDQVIIHSLDFHSSNSFSIDHLEKEGSNWIEYVKGTAWSLLAEGYPLTGWEGVMMGDIPIGAGLSSSAALEMAAIIAFSIINGFTLPIKKMALLGQKAENQWIGVNCGIMDQLISVGGAENQALLIDCRSLGTQSVQLPSETDIVVMDTATRRGLMDSAYNERRSQCETVARYFKVPFLRDINLEQLESNRSSLGDVTFKRARHVVSENHRTLRAVQALHDNNIIEFGKLLYASHLSLRDDFEVSSDGLNCIVEVAMQSSSCLGARMTGAGFGGCAIALIKEGTSQQFSEELTEKYRIKTNLTPEVYVCKASKGAELYQKPVS